MNATGEVLLVDDTPENLRVLGDLLAQQGFAVRVAASGAMALRSVEMRAPDLVLLDIHMPDLDGFATCRRMRGQPGMLGVPVLFLSASEASDDRLQAFAAGGADFIAKPFVAAEVLARVTTHLSLSRARRELDLANDRLAEQVMAEAHLRDAAETMASDRQARLALSLEAARMGAWEVQDGTMVLDARAREIFGAPPGFRPRWSEVLRQCGSDATSPGEVQLDAWWAPPSAGHPARRRIRLVGRRLGSRGDGPLVGVVWDITEEHRLREQAVQRERLEAVGVLAGGLAHDLNNQLGVIQGAIEVLHLGGTVTATCRPHLDRMIQASEASLALVRDLLGFARKRELQRTVIDLRGVAERLMRLAGPSLGTAITCEVRSPPVPVWSLGDAGQLENALLNLYLNARDAMPQGGSITCTVGTATVDDVLCRSCNRRIDGRWAVITVSDTGAGIPDDLCGRVFEPFFTTKPEGLGTGLGLASVAGCVASHDGHITLDSVPGAGSRFALLLPLCDPPAQHVASQPQAASTANGRLLVVDDQPTVRAVVADGLRLLGWTVDDCGDGAAAVAAWRDCRNGGEPYRAAIVDLVMPGMGGVAVFHALRAIDPTAQVVLMSGHAAGSRLEELRSEGLAAFLDKPVKIRDLARLLANLPMTEVR